MVHTQLVGAITNGFQPPTLPKQPGNTDYTSIRDTHCLLTTNAASIQGPCGGGQNGHLGLVLTKTQYVLTSKIPFVFPTNPGCTPTIPEWTTSFDKKALLCDNEKQH